MEYQFVDIHLFGIARLQIGSSEKISIQVELCYSRYNGSTVGKFNKEYILIIS